MHGAGALASHRFRFRFVARGEQATKLVALAVQSLARCHPGAAVVVVDANETRALNRDLFRVPTDLQVVHVRPTDDPVARVVGRGTRQHLFYWRHSPQLRQVLPPCDRYDVHADSDLLFLRPMDLSSLLRPVGRGRVAAAVDESSLEHHAALGVMASSPAAALFPAVGVGGPLLQAGLIFTDPCNDGGLYDLCWDLAVVAARSGHLSQLPADDMCIVTAVLGQGGPLWERLLPLGHDWNYITDAVKDPGVFGCVAHYGGRAKALLLARTSELLPPQGDDGAPWGTVTMPRSAERATVFRGPWQRGSPRPGCWPGDSAGAPLAVPLPFALTWLVPAGVTTAVVAGVLEANRGDRMERAGATLFVYVDGRLVRRLPITSKCPGGSPPGPRRDRHRHRYLRLARVRAPARGVPRAQPSDWLNAWAAETSSRGRKTQLCDSHPIGRPGCPGRSSTSSTRWGLSKSRTSCPAQPLTSAARRPFISRPGSWPGGATRSGSTIS